MAAEGVTSTSEGQTEAGPRIKVLAHYVAEAIAAGEVIDRPAAAVKELLENSLDAGARRIEVEIEEGGVDLIRVVDDGSGMTPAELSVAFQRHATSKLTVIDDLLRLRTLGFRGEALASIAAVSRVTVVSRAGESGRAHSLTIDGSQRRGPSITAAPVGTGITCRALFHNLPARRAFLKSARAEASACVRVVTEAALSRPDVRFELRSQGRRVFSAGGSGGLAAVLTAAFGRDAAAGVLEVGHVDQDISVRGLIGPPEAARASRQAMVEMVNGRRVHHRGIEAAVIAAYRGLLPGDRFPLAVIDVHLDPSLADVNVHPTKREVKFRDEGAVFEVVQRGCWDALQGSRPRSFVLPESTSAQVVAQQLPLSQFETGARNPVEQSFAPGPTLSDAVSWRYLGQAHNRYLVAQTSSGLAVIDQHAAHEKVLYRSWLDELRQVSGQPHPAQGLLEPILIEAAEGSLGHATEQGLDLVRLGFDLEQFGPTTLRCTAAPVGLPVGLVPQTLLELLEIAGQGGEWDADKRHRMAASLACHSAVRFGDRLDDAQASALIRDLATTEGGITCPHGRPALLLLSEAQLLTAFQRR
jgi:DNA mismatch repair protein MutL